VPQVGGTLHISVWLRAYLTQFSFAKAAAPAYPFPAYNEMNGRNAESAPQQYTYFSSLLFLFLQNHFLFFSSGAEGAMFTPSALAWIAFRPLLKMYAFQRLHYSL
jgi:hypothetical protein